MIAAGLLGTIFIIYAGFIYITSSGDESKVKTAKKSLSGAIIGIALAILANPINNTIKSVVNVGTNDGNVVKNALNLLFVAIGVAASVMIVFSGIKYSSAGGDAAKIKSAKQSIIYAIVGLVIAILAGIITNFVMSTLS